MSGLAVGHVEPMPRLLDLPVRKTAKGASIAIESTQAVKLEPGATLSTDRTFLIAHTGDHFAPLTQYRQFLAEEGIVAPKAPESAFAPVWCAWGYEREFTVEQIVDTLPKVRELGFEWAVLDDGWQNNEGDWYIDKRKFPLGDESMRAFVKAIRAQGLRPRLWIAPLAADPGSDVLHDHADMLLLDEWGAFQTVSWWNALTQCPAYQPTIDYYVALTRKIIGDWGFEGLKLDGQHLNSVAPCYNKAHGHTHPNESVEKLGDFWLAIHAAARAGESRGRGGTVSLRHGVQLPQPAGDGPVPDFGSAQFLAGAQQGQDLQGHHRARQQPRRRSRGACPIVAMTSRPAWASAR